MEYKWPNNLTKTCDLHCNVNKIKKSISQYYANNQEIIFSKGHIAMAAVIEGLVETIIQKLEVIPEDDVFGIEVTKAIFVPIIKSNPIFIKFVSNVVENIDNLEHNGLLLNLIVSNYDFNFMVKNTSADIELTEEVENMILFLIYKVFCEVLQVAKVLLTYKKTKVLKPDTISSACELIFTKPLFDIINQKIYDTIDLIEYAGYESATDS